MGHAMYVCNGLSFMGNAVYYVRMCAYWTITNGTRGICVYVAMSLMGHAVYVCI
jgi:hypothetical protein